MDRCPGRAINETHICYCLACNDSFMMVGNTPIRLGEWRTPEMARGGGFRTGVCPIHRLTKDINPRLFR
jgi:hypothetical protein